MTLIGPAISRLRKRRQDPMQAQYDGAMGASAASGARAEGEYLDRALAFNPQASVERSAQGAYNSVREQLTKDVSKMRGQQSAMGRLRTGMATDDEDELVSSAYDRLNNTIAQNSMHAAGLEQQNNAQIGAYGQNATGRYLDLMTGRMDREQANRNAKADRNTGLLTAGAGIVGSLVGGPAGGALATGASKLLSRLFRRG